MCNIALKILLMSMPLILVIVIASVKIAFGFNLPASSAVWQLQPQRCRDHRLPWPHSYHAMPCHTMQKYYGLPHSSIPCHTYQSITTPHQPPALAYHLIEYPSPKHPDISVNTASIPDWNKDTAPYRFNLTSWSGPEWPQMCGINQEW